MHIDVYNGYPFSVFLALTFHSVVLGGLLYLQAERPSEVMDILQPPIIKAILVNENPQIRQEELLEQQRLIRIEDQRRAREEADRRAREEQARAEAAAQQQAREQAEREAAAERERQAAARRDQQAREAEAQREREAAEAREREARQRQEAEAQRQRELAAEQERQRQRDAEAAAAVAADIARTEAEMVASYSAVIHDLVQRNWDRPPSARNGMTAVLRIRMVPTGDILEVEIVRSSGDPAFDRAAETAVYRVGQFRELQGMPINLFNQNFRSFLLTFRPEDLLN